MSIEPEMSWRARIYIAVIVGRHIALGSVLLGDADAFRAASFNSVSHAMPLQYWSGLFLGVGIIAAIAAVIGREWLCRASIVVSAIVTSSWALLFLIAAFTGSLDAPPLPIVWSAMVVKDLVVAAMPMRTPFEDLVYRELERRQ